jgi:rsbT co-antagonist protein RsbR
MAGIDDVIARAVQQRRDAILSGWAAEQSESDRLRSHLLDRATVDEQSARLLDSLTVALQSAGSGPIDGSAWDPTRDVLDDISSDRAHRGFSPVEVAAFIFALKRPAAEVLAEALRDRPDELIEATWRTDFLLDSFGLYTTEVAQRARVSIIARQQQEILELSTPVVQLWDSILAVPLIGTLDSARTQVVMETLLEEIVRTQSDVAIIDITGVPTVDTAVAQHLLRTVAAARLMGADCIISGIRPQIAQTIVHLGVELGDITTKASLAAAFRVALERTGRAVLPL